MSEVSKVRYDVEVMARLRYPMPDPAGPDDDPETDDLVREDVWEDRRRYARELTEDYDQWVENSYLAADAEGVVPAAPPGVLAMEISRVSDQLAALEAFRDRLLVYARSLAAQPVPARALAKRTGLSHSTIVRMTTAEAIADVATEAAPAAHNALADVDPRDDPQFFLRLQYAAHHGREG